MAKGRLREVEEDAVRITTKRFKDFFEEQEYKASKAQEANKKAPIVEDGKETK